MPDPAPRFRNVAATRRQAAHPWRLGIPLLCSLALLAFSSRALLHTLASFQPLLSGLLPTDSALAYWLAH